MTVSVIAKRGWEFHEMLFFPLMFQPMGRKKCRLGGQQIEKFQIIFVSFNITYSL